MLRRLQTAAREKLADTWPGMVDDDQRRDLIFVWFNGIMGFVAGFMTVVNVFTGKWLLMCSTLIFCLVCPLNIWISKRGHRRLIQDIFLVEVLILCGFFCISGTPEGFSALWTCFIPSFSLTLLGNRRGSFYSGTGFLMVAGIFWTSWGRALLRYGYTDSFMLRFPMIYLAFYMMALFLETIRSETQKRLVEAERRYQHLYKHDALTGIYNRYGFNERLNQVFSDDSVKELALLILDLDLFKSVNDTYGHDAGDVVLKFSANTLLRLAGDDAVVCRWGGEEFTVLLWSGEDPMALAERVRREIENAGITVNGRSVRITASVGVCAVGDRKDITIAQLVKTADQCLYRAKEAGRNRVEGTRL